MIIGIVIGLILGVFFAILILGLCTASGRSALESDNLYLKQQLNELLIMLKDDGDIEESLLNRFIKEFCYSE